MCSLVGGKQRAGGAYSRDGDRDRSDGHDAHNPTFHSGLLIPDRQDYKDTHPA